MSDYEEYFLNADVDLIQYECIEISHPSFSKVYRIVRNSVDNLTVTLENSTVVTFEYYPLKITKAETSDNLEYSIKIEFGDVGENVPDEIERVVAANTFLTKPVFIYRSYKSDNLALPMFGPITLEITELNLDRNGCAFEAKAKNLNINGSGITYSVSKFPSLRSFL
jgi:hypothetical protein